MELLSSSGDIEASISLRRVSPMSRTSVALTPRSSPRSSERIRRRRTVAQGRAGDSWGLNGVRTAVAGTDADRLLDVEHENLAVADTAGPSGILDRFDDVLDEAVLDHHL